MAGAAMIATLAVLLFALPVLAQTERELDEAQTFRRDFALPSSMAVVRDSFADRGTYSDMSRGIPLTPAEAAELDRRRDIVWQSEPAREFARTLDGYADVYIDQDRGGIPVFRFTDELAAARAAIAEVMPDGVDFDVEKAEFTIKQLRNKQERITEDMLETDWLLDGEIQLVSAGASVKANRVLVGVLEEANMARARAILQDRYGPMVDVEYIGPTEEDTCSSRNSCRDPIKGGLKLQRNGNFKCTSGFGALRGGNSVPVILFAGHCITQNGGSNCNAGSEVYWQHNGGNVGCAKGESLPSGGGLANSDTGWINLDANDDEAPLNQIFGEDNNDIRNVNQVLGGSDLVEDEELCRSGGTSLWDCGQVKATCVDKSNGVNLPNGDPKWTIECVATLGRDSTGGDSGAPWVREKSGSNVAAAGIHVHSSVDGSCSGTACRSWFSKANRAQNDSDAAICISASCGN
jgi:hypothetical protein